MSNTLTVWLIIISIGLGTYLIRFSFIGLIGDKELPEWFLRHLRYVATAVIPALITPLVIWPDATGGETDPARLLAALVVFVIGIKFDSVIGGVVAGMATLYSVQFVLA